MYGKREAWKTIGSNCVIYGATVLAVALSVGLLLQTTVPLRPDIYLSNMTFYALVVAVPALAVYSLRKRFQEVSSCPPESEIAIAALAILGFSAPVTALGVLILAITIPDYEGVDRWLPEIKDRSHYELSKLQEAVYELELSEDVEARAEHLIEEMRDRELMKGRSFNSMLGGLIYIVARDEGEPRTLDEISEVVRAEKRDVGKSYRYIGRELGLNIIPPLPEDYLERFGEKLGLSDEVVETAKETVERAYDKNIISGKSSKGIAAASLYLSAYAEGEKRSLNEMSDVLSVTTVTIRERARDLRDALELENVPENLRRESA